MGQTSLLSLLIDPATDLILDNTTKPLFEAILGEEMPSTKDIREKGSFKAVDDLKAQQASAPLETAVSSTSSKPQVVF